MKCRIDLLLLVFLMFILLIPSRGRVELLRLKRVTCSRSATP
jgi:hypothetical protein